jgi:hypothetical protein
LKGKAAKLWGFIVSPLGMLLLGTLLASVLIPRWSAIWQDRQPELELKAGLVERVAQSTTETVREAISLVRTPPPTKVAAARYRALTNQWLIDRAEIQTVVGTYFSANVARCWFLYSDRITSYISVPRPGTRSSGYLRELEDYIEDERKSCEPLVDAASYSQQRYDDLKQNIGDFSALSSADTEGFKGAYASLGELLLIDRDRIVRTMVSSDARGFAHGWWIFRS